MHVPLAIDSTSETHKRVMALYISIFDFVSMHIYMKKHLLIEMVYVLTMEKALTSFRVSLSAESFGPVQATQ
jgi:hypothetical protein